jgi:phosphonate transport system substrate-binding protein
MSGIGFKLFLGLFLLSLIFCQFGSAYAGEGLTLGVHPFLPATELVNRFTPLAEYLSEKTGLPVTISIARDYEEHIERAGGNELDIAYMGPASYVIMVDEYGKKPLLARLEIGGIPTFKGVLIVAEDSPVSTVADLAGRRFAFGDSNSTMSHLVPRFMMWEAGVGVDELAGYKFLKSHHNVALGVLMGDFDAGAVKEEVFYEYKERGLIELSRTLEISEHVFVASSRLPPEKVRAMREALYGLRDTEEGRAIMSGIKKDMTGMAPASDGDYDNLRTILRTLEKLGVKP